MRRIIGVLIIFFIFIQIGSVSAERRFDIISAWGIPDIISSGGIIFDVRNYDEYKEGHVKDAIWFDRSKKEPYADRYLKDLPQNSKLIFYSSLDPKKNATGHIIEIQGWFAYDVAAWVADCVDPEFVSDPYYDKITGKGFYTYQVQEDIMAEAGWLLTNWDIWGETETGETTNGIPTVDPSTPKGGGEIFIFFIGAVVVLLVGVTCYAIYHSNVLSRFSHFDSQEEKDKRRRKILSEISEIVEKKAEKEEKKEFKLKRRR